jgi:hypothetical protein
MKRAASRPQGCPFFGSAGLSPGAETFRASLLVGEEDFSKAYILAGFPADATVLQKSSISPDVMPVANPGAARLRGGYAELTADGSEPKNSY